MLRPARKAGLLCGAGGLLLLPPRRAFFEKNTEADMSKSDPHRIEDSDLYLFLGILCYALDSPICGGIALSIALFIFYCSFSTDIE